MVHPKKSCGELMHPMCLKLKQRQKDTLKLTRKETTVLLQTALRITQDRAHNKLKKLIFNGFFAVAYHQPTFQTEE